MSNTLIPFSGRVAASAAPTAAVAKHLLCFVTDLTEGNTRLANKLIVSVAKKKIKDEVRKNCFNV